MIWKKHNTWEVVRKRKSDWHKWWAWKPVIVVIYLDGTVDMAWLQWVERKGSYSCYGWEYAYRKGGVNNGTV